MFDYEVGIDPRNAEYFRSNDFPHKSLDLSGEIYFGGQIFVSGSVNENTTVCEQVSIEPNEVVTLPLVQHE